MPFHLTEITTTRHLKQGTLGVLQGDQVEAPWISGTSDAALRFVFNKTMPPSSEIGLATHWHRQLLQQEGSLVVQDPICRLITDYMDHSGLTEAEFLEYPRIGVVRNHPRS